MPDGHVAELEAQLRVALSMAAFPDPWPDEIDGVPLPVWWERAQENCGWHPVIPEWKRERQ